MKPDYRPPTSQMLSIATVKIRWDVALKSQRRALTGDILSWSDWVVPAVRNRRDGDEGEDHPPLHRPFDNPHDAVREHGTYGGQGKAVGCLPPTALLFGALRTSGQGATGLLQKPYSDQWN